MTKKCPPLKNDNIRENWLKEVTEITVYGLEPGCKFAEFVTKLDYLCLMFKSYWLKNLSGKILKEIFNTFIQNICDLCAIFHQFMPISPRDMGKKDQNDDFSSLLYLYRSCFKVKNIIAHICEIAHCQNSIGDEFYQPVRESKKALEGIFIGRINNKYNASQLSRQIKKLDGILTCDSEEDEVHAVQKIKGRYDRKVHILVL